MLKEALDSLISVVITFKILAWRTDCFILEHEVTRLTKNGVFYRNMTKGLSVLEIVLG